MLTIIPDMIPQVIAAPMFTAVPAIGPNTIPPQMMPKITSHSPVLPLKRTESALEEMTDELMAKKRERKASCQM